MATAIRSSLGEKAGPEYAAGDPIEPNCLPARSNHVSRVIESPPGEFATRGDLSGAWRSGTLFIRRAPAPRAANATKTTGHNQRLDLCGGWKASALCVPAA